MTGYKKLSLIVLSIVAVLAVAVMIGRMGGTTSGQQTKDRLQLVWPSLMAMPESNRAFIVGLAMTCRLEQRPSSANEVVACLREAANDPNVTLPKGVDKTTAPARLEKLLSERAGNGS